MKHVRLKSAISIFLLSITNISFADNRSSIKFFFSNNTNEISIEEAYERMNSIPQHVLKNSAIDILQKKHIEQGKFEKILGTYKMAASKKITADNTEIFFTSPYQYFANDQVFLLARQLASAFQQESVAVFIPSNQSAIADIVVQFKSSKPNIAEAIQLIHQKLPAYESAYSLHLNNDHAVFSNTQVREIEWLGSSVNINEIKKIFPQEVVFYSQGKAYLVYKNGQIEAI